MLGFQQVLSLGLVKVLVLVQVVLRPVGCLGCRIVIVLQMVDGNRCPVPPEADHLGRQVSLVRLHMRLLYLVCRR